MHLVRNKDDSSDILGNAFVLSSKPELYRLTDNRTMYITRTAVVILLDVCKVTAHVPVRGGINFSDFWELTDTITYVPGPGKGMIHFLQRLEITHLLESLQSCWERRTTSCHPVKKCSNYSFCFGGSW
jgi:hypothetical protein